LYRGKKKSRQKIYIKNIQKNAKVEGVRLTQSAVFEEMTHDAIVTVDVPAMYRPPPR